MPTKQRAINQKTILHHTRKLFTLTQAFPVPVLNLLQQKRRRDLTQKQQKQIYDNIKERNLFPVLTNPKTIIDFCTELSIEVYKAGRIIQESQDLFIILDGAIKIFQDNSRGKTGDGGEGLRLSISAAILHEQQGYKIEKYKLGVGEVLLFDKDNSNLMHIVSSTVTLLKIPYNTHSSISLSSFMIETKRKQQFFSKIALFERHYRSSLQDFISSLEQKSCGFGQRIFTQGQLVTKIYIIKQGQFILQKNICTDDFILKKGKVVQKDQNKTSQSFIRDQIKYIPKHYRSTPYKIIGPKEILGDCQYVFNNRVYLYSMRCHKQGSKLYTMDVEMFFKKVYVAENGVDRVNQLLEDVFQQRKRQIQAGVKFNKSNTLMLKFMPNSTLRYKTQSQHSVSPQKKTSSTISQYNSTQRSHSFFQKMNKTIINQTKGQIRKRNESRNIEIANEDKLKKIYKTPAVVQEVVHIVNQKKMYHRLRNMGKGNKCAFEFDINNVPPFIKKKYAHILKRDKSQ